MSSTASLTTIRESVMPDLEAIKSILLPQKEKVGEKYEEILQEYKMKVLSRIVLIESFHALKDRVKDVWSVIHKYRSGYTPYARAEAITDDLRNTGVLTEKEIRVINFMLENDYRSHHVDRVITDILRRLCHDLRVKLSGYHIFPLKGLFRRKGKKTLSELLRYWKANNFKPFYLSRKQVHQELANSTEMQSCNNIIATLAKQCKPLSEINDDEKQALAEYICIKDRHGQTHLEIFTTCKNIRLLGAKSKSINGPRAVFDVRSIEKEACVSRCSQRPTCQVEEY